MSPSMWAWRVIVPGLGLVACALVLRESSKPEVPVSSRSAAEARPKKSPGRLVAEGRVVARPGAEVTVGTEAGGTVLSVPGREKARVRKGDVLVEFRPDDLQFALLEAESRLAEAESDRSYHLWAYQRKVKASTAAAQFVAELQAQRHELEVAVARRKGAEVAVSRARSSLARARVTSPIDGVILATHVEPGEVAGPGSRLVTVCDLSRLRIEAEVDEFDASRISEGDEVLIKAEGYGDATWPARVEEVPDRVAIRTIRPDDPGRPTDTPVLLVKIGPTPPVALKLGQQVEVEIRPGVRAAPSPSPTKPPGPPVQAGESKSR